MARIPHDELERLKREVSVQRLAEARGVKLSGHGEDLLGLCPFHDDHEPSLVVSPRKNLWHCLGACSTGGSVVDWVMTAEGVGFRHAVEILRDRLGTSPLEGEGFRIGSAGLACPLAFDAPDRVVMDQVVEYYHGVLMATPDARGYLERRGIWSEEAARVFRLGFVDRSLGLRIPKRNTAAGTRLRDQLSRLGVLRSSGHEHLRGCVVVPVSDAEGTVTEVYGRRVDSVHGGGSPHLYLPGPHRGLFNLEALRASKELILCEALLDALTFWVHGFHHVTATYGGNGFSTEMLEALEAYGVERVLIAFDRDAAGDAAAKKTAERLAGVGISAWRVLFPRGMDANEYATKVKPAAQSLGVLVRAAEHLAGPLVTRSTRNPPAARAAKDPASTSVSEGACQASALAASSAGSGATETQAAPGSSEEGSPEARSCDAPPAGLVPASVSDHETCFALGERWWRVRGLARNLSYEQLRVNLLVRSSEHYHVDTLDLYSARQRKAFLSQAATELGVEPAVVKADLGRVLLALEQLQEERIRSALEPSPEPAPMPEADRSEALELLRAPDLMERISAAFEACGLVGETTNRLVAYLAAVSRKLERPLAVVVQSSSAAGKSALANAVLDLTPEEDQVSYSAMTGQSLFYMGQTDLKHKLLAIAEEEGAERASYPLKLLQSEGELSIASTAKDPKTGRLATQEYRVEGPVALMLTTTAVDLDEELQNRCLVLSVDEGREQTRAIHDRQREAETLEGWRGRRRRSQVVALHRNAQRLVKPLAVVNPYARGLTFPDSCTRMRRDHQKYLSLIRAIALVHQHQREVRTDSTGGSSAPYVEVTLSDIELANRLAAEVLGRTLDELPPQTRRLLQLVGDWVEAEASRRRLPRDGVRFTRRQVREATGWSAAQVRTHLDRLVEMEYVLAHHGSRGRRFVYELVWDGQGVTGEPFLMGLIDVESLRKVNGRTIATLTPHGRALTPSKADHEGRLTPGGPPFDPTLRGGENHREASSDIASRGETSESGEKAHREASNEKRSYRRAEAV